MLNKIGDAFEKFLMPIADSMNKNKYILAIRDAFTLMMGIIIVGSFALLFNIYICGSHGLAGIQSLSWLANYSGIFTTVNYACVSCMALWLVFFIGYSLGDHDGLKPLMTGLIASVCFIVLSDQENLSSSFGASALFLAIITGSLSEALFNWLMHFEKLKIKLPESVPPMIANSFNSLIPCAITISVFGLFAGILYGSSGMYINTIIYNVLEVPFNQALSSRLGISIIVVLSQLLWWFGIHGNMALNAIAKPVRAANIAANMEAVAAGLAPTAIYTLAFQHTFSNLGGAGIVISLALALLAFSKRQEAKDLMKVVMIPLICGISEPVVFGLPIMLNPIFLIPFVLVPLITANIGYTAMASGFLTPSYVESIAGMPMFIQQFLSFSGQWQALLLTLIVIAVGFVCYVPFVLLDNREYEKEQKNL